MRTDSISQSTNKGKHVTSHRELFILENGGILVDNPGMREVGITDSGGRIGDNIRHDCHSFEALQIQGLHSYD